VAGSKSERPSGINITFFAKIFHSCLKCEHFCKGKKISYSKNFRTNYQLRHLLIADCSCCFRANVLPVLDRKLDFFIVPMNSTPWSRQTK
jgi:hypothetical protein